MRVFSPNNMSSLAYWVAENGDNVPSERGDTIEVLNASLVVRNPRNRFDTTRSRKLNIAFAFAEWLSLMTGVYNIGYFTNFIKSYDRFSSDGKFLDGAYGPRATLQIAEAANLLRSKPESRRAVVSIYSDRDIFGYGGLNTPCTLSFQFLVRNGNLNMFANMRSNDIYLGLANDVVVNTMTQEWMALATSTKLGEYYHNAASLHIYKADLEKVLGPTEDEGRWPHLMKPMDKTMADYHELETLVGIYGNFRTFEDAIIESRKLKSVYANDIAMVGLSFLHRNSPNGLLAYKQIDDPTLRRLSLPWVKK